MLLDIVQADLYIINMTKVPMKRFVVWVGLADDGSIVSAHIQDNVRFDSIWLDLEKAPDYIHERIALVKLTDVNKSAKGEILGRRLDTNVLVIYLDLNEYKQIKEECE